MIYILAGSYQQFNTYCNENKISTRSPLIHYVSDYRSIMGIARYSIMIKYGTWYERDDVHKIIDYQEARGIKIL